MNNPCETCDDTGYVWREGPDGRDWMFDCDNEDCNAFGQLDDCVGEWECEHCGKTITHDERMAGLCEQCWEQEYPAKGDK